MVKEKRSVCLGTSINKETDVARELKRRTRLARCKQGKFGRFSHDRGTSTVPLDLNTRIPKIGVFGVLALDEDNVADRLQ